MSNQCDVLLIYPKTGVDFAATIAPPHALLSLAAPLINKGYKVKLIDQRVDPFWKDKIQKYLDYRPICVGISTMTGTQISFALEAAKEVRRVSQGKVPIVWGGAHPSSIPEQTAEDENVDYVCVGEGEETFCELLSALSNREPVNCIQGLVYKDGSKIIRNNDRPLMDVEQLLPVPWELVDIEKYIHRDFYLKGTQRSLDIGQTSRGCPFQCGFCSSATLRRRKWRAMSVEKSLHRILEPIKRYKLDSIWIRDDEFYIDRKRTSEICKGIIKENLNLKWYTSGTRVDVFNKSTADEIELLKRSGADTLKFGAESGSDRILDLMKKGIKVEDTLRANLKAREHGIIPAFALMIGFPTETFLDIHKTIDLYVKLRKENPQAQFELIGTYTALPCTPLYSLALEHGLRPPSRLSDWSTWLSDEYDLEGRKIPWFSKTDRKRIGNITYMSILANSSLNAIGGVENRIFRKILTLIFKPLSWFERIKLIHKFYSFAPELDIARFLRKKLFY